MICRNTELTPLNESNLGLKWIKTNNKQTNKQTQSDIKVKAS